MLRNTEFSLPFGSLHYRLIWLRMTKRIDSIPKEPACGSGNFLVEILKRKLAVVELKYGEPDFDIRIWMRCSGANKGGYYTNGKV
jgi:hypothetical protein